MSRSQWLILTPMYEQAGDTFNISGVLLFHTVCNTTIQLPTYYGTVADTAKDEYFVLSLDADIDPYIANHECGMPDLAEDGEHVINIPTTFQGTSITG